MTARDPASGKGKGKSTRAPYTTPVLKRLGPLEVITQGASRGSTPDRRTGTRSKRGRR